MDSKFIEYIEPVFESLCRIAEKTLPIKKDNESGIVSTEIDDKHKSVFPMMFMLSEDKGKSFQWFLTKKQREYGLIELSGEKVQPDVYFDHWIRYKFFASGMVSYIRDTKRITEYIEDFTAETVLVETAYAIDNLYPFNAELLREAEQRKLLIGSDVKNELKKFERIWGFNKTPFFYFEVFDEESFNKETHRTDDVNELRKEGDKKEKAQYKIYGLIPCHNFEEQTQNNRAKYMINVLELISLSKTYLEASYSLRTKIEKDMDLSKRHAMRSAIAAIMSRNGSHNIGSHVINRVVENMDLLNVQDHKYFLRYLQQRMDFVAQISTDFPRWSTSHWFVMEIMKNFYSQKHLLNYIAESEGLKAYEQNGDKDTKEEKLQCIIKSIKKYNCKSSKEPPSYDESYCEFSDPEIIDCKYKDGAQVLVCDLDICKADPNGDIKIAVPGGLVGFHALYTIIENFLRNSAKHNYARYPAAEKENRKEPMLITFKIWNYEDVHDYYTVRIRDNYSYISGLIAESTFEEESAEDLNEKKILILHPVAEVVENIKLCLEEKENIRFDLANHENIADNTYDIIFIIDDGKVFREKGIKPGYCDLMLDSRVRFIEEAYWNDFLRKTKPTPISVDDQIRFLKQYFIPAHLKINNKIINPLIEDDGSLRKSDWGIAEMKISAGFLYKKDISQIGGGGEKNLDNLIKAIAIPEYRDGKIRAYRLGYEFRMLKPVDVLLIGHSGDDNEALKREAILPVDKYDKTKYSAEMAIILDAGDKLLSLLKFSENNIDKIKTLIEYYPGRLFIVSDDGKVKDKISGSKFIEKRIILISSEEFNKIFKDSNYTAFKNELLKRWICHIMKLKAKEELHIVVNPTESPSVKSKIDPTSLLDAFLFLKSAITEQDGMRLIKEKKVYQEILNRMLSGNIRDRRELKRILECDYKIDCNGINSVNTDGIKDIVDKTKPFIKRIFDDYGIFQSESYTPSTLPEIFKEKSITGNDVSSKLNSATDYFNQIKIYFHRESVNLTDQPKIIYERHRGIEKIEGFVYQENLGGGAVHFHLFAYPKNWIEEFAANITENGLLKIAIMDERVAGSNILKNYHIDLEAAGVYFIKKFFGFELDYEWSDDRFISIDEDGSKFIKDKKDFDIDILIIHQGLLDKMDTIDKETIADRFRQLKEFIPFIYVTSGRGRPDTIPEGVKYVPFGIIESTLLQKPHSKLLLTKQLLGGISD